MDGVGAVLPDGLLVIGKQESLPVGAEGISPWGHNLGIYRICSAIQLGRS